MNQARTLMEQLAGHVQHGDHLCVIYDDPRDRIEAAAQYIADGLRQNEFVMYAADPEATAELSRELERHGVDVAHEIRRGALRFPTADEAYLRNGDFDPEGMLREFDQAIQDALQAGFSGCRFAGEPLWALDRETLRPGLIEFEARLNELFKSRKAAGLCVYDKRLWPPAIVRDVLRTHPIAVVGDLVCRNNLYYERADLIGTDASAESQVEWMLAQLRELRIQESRLQVALEAGRLGSWELDLKTDTAVRSLRHDQIFGYARFAPQWGYEIFMQHVLPEDRERVDRAFREALEKRSTWHFECRIRRVSDGAIRWIEAHGRPEPDALDNSRIERLLGIVADITERKEMEQALREADRRKDEFLATLAHELRNPLAPITNAVQLIRMKAPPDPQLRRAEEMIDRQVRHLVRLVDDLLEVSRITTGRINLQRARINLRSVIASAVEASQPLIEASRHEFSLSLPAEPVYVEADATRLAQVFLNLLNNAAKYTPPGGRIELSVSRAGAEVVARVRDNGMGIPAQMLPEIFKMFVQGHRTGERAQSGLGIGLSLAKQLLELHGGSITAHSAGPGKGSEFVVRLPACAEAEASETGRNEASAASTATRRRILVVDDNVDAADSLAINLQLLGHEVSTSYDGRAALESAQRLKPDVVVLDIGLPDLDGYEVARQLRALLPRDGVTLVALTGWGQEKDRQRASEAGFDQHFTKPVDPQQLIRVIVGGESVHSSRVREC